MRKLILAAVLALAFAAGAFAQTLNFFPFAPGTAFPELVPPCAADRIEPMIFVIDSHPQAWGIWHCLDGRFIPYRFTTVTGIGTPEPIPEPEPRVSTASACPGGAPRPGWICVNGGWRDPITVR